MRLSILGASWLWLVGAVSLSQLPSFAKMTLDSMNLMFGVTATADEIVAAWAGSAAVPARSPVRATSA